MIASCLNPAVLLISQELQKNMSRSASLKPRRVPGCDDALVLGDDSLILHCFPNVEGRVRDGIGVNLVVNMKHPGGKSTMMLALKKKDVKKFTDFVSGAVGRFNGVTK